jgi:uncharacterized membrane protein
MNLRNVYVLGGIVIAFELVVAAWGLAQVGLDASVPIHWDLNGNPDAYASALVAFLLGPAITAGVLGILAIVPRVEPRREHLRRSASAYRTTVIATTLLLALVQAVTVLAGVGYDVPIGGIIGAGVGILLAVIGNVMTTVRSTFMFGVRTPWTLTSERSWDKTNRLVGRLFVVTGLLMVVASLTGNAIVVLGLMTVMLIGSIVVGFIYSYRVWKDDPDKKTSIVGGDAS